MHGTCAYYFHKRYISWTESYKDNLQNDDLPTSVFFHSLPVYCQRTYAIMFFPSSSLSVDIVLRHMVNYRYFISYTCVPIYHITAQQNLGNCELYSETGIHLCFFICISFQLLPFSLPMIYLVYLCIYVLCSSISKLIYCDLNWGNWQPYLVFFQHLFKQQLYHWAYQLHILNLYVPSYYYTAKQNVGQCCPLLYTQSMIFAQVFMAEEKLELNLCALLENLIFYTFSYREDENNKLFIEYWIEDFKSSKRYSKSVRCIFKIIPYHSAYTAVRGAPNSLLYHFIQSNLGGKQTAMGIC